jgi:U32 family peptidase
MADEKQVGTITHYYSNLGVGIIKLDSALKVGDNIKVQGSTTDLEQDVTEMQFDHKDVDSGKAGQEVGIKVDRQVRQGDSVYLA